MEIQHDSMTAEQKQLLEDEISKQQKLHVERKMTVKEMMQETYPKLKQPFPKEAHQPVLGNSLGLTMIKAQYVIERLNDVFGVDGWQFERKEAERIDNEVVVSGILVIKNNENGGIAAARHAAGGGRKNKSNTWGDAYKSADTDAISKAASHLGIGNDVFKGLVAQDGSPKKAGSTAKSTGKGFGGAKRTANKSATTSAPVDDI